MAIWFKEQAKAMGLTGSQLAEALSGEDEEDMLEPEENITHSEGSVGDSVANSTSEEE